VVGWFVSFVDDDEPEVFDWCEEGGAGADDDLRLGTIEDILPEEVAGGLGLLAVEESDVVKVFLKILDKLASESDFGYEDDGGFLVC